MSTVFSMGVNTHKIPMSLFAENRTKVCSALQNQSCSLKNCVILLQGGEEVPWNDTDVSYVFKQVSTKFDLSLIILIIVRFKIQANVLFVFFLRIEDVLINNKNIQIIFVIELNARLFVIINSAQLAKPDFVKFHYCRSRFCELIILKLSTFCIKCNAI